MNNYFDKVESEFDEKFDGIDLPYEYVREDIKALYRQAFKEYREELKSKLDKYKCDFNWDFEKNKAKHKSYISLQDINKVLDEN